MIAIMTNDAHQISLNAVNLPADKAGTAPEWVHLLPTVSGQITTDDKRGPYHVTDAEQIIAVSMAEGDRLPIDENHATDLAAPKGLPAPARGWITELQARDDGIWGKVEWTDEGEALVASRAYRGISPVIRHDKGKRISAIARASLVNRPNLQGLASLHQQEDTDMSFRASVAGWLGLSPDASDTDIQTAIEGASKGAETTALQSQISEIGTALGVADGGDILAAAKAAKDAGKGDNAQITALQSSVAALETQNAALETALTALTAQHAEDASTNFVDGEIAKGRIGLKAKREQWIAMHQSDPEGTADIIAGIPAIGGETHLGQPAPDADGEISLNASQRAACVALGVSEDEYLKTLKEEAN